MVEEWRVTVTPAEEDDTALLLSALRRHEAAADGRGRLGERIAVSGGEGHVFLYADSDGAAREAEQVVSGVLSEQGIKAEVALDRWHHAAEEWEDARVPLPTTAAASRAEHQRLEAQEEATSRSTGIAEWELRIELASHGDAVALAARLEREGFSHIVRRWRFLLVGGEAEDEVRLLAEQLRTEIPPGASVTVEPGGGRAWRSNPFAVFGGLAG
jgi:hypothetical protein